MTVEQPYSFRWLGANGIEIAGAGSRLAVDPFFTRPPLRRLWSGRVPPDRETILQKIRPYRYLLVTHNHFDHVMDVPVIAKETGADIYGTENTFNLLLALGLPPAQLHPIHPGDRLSLGEFAVEVFNGDHPKTPVDRFVNGPLPEELDPPLRLFDYRMDERLHFRIGLDDSSLLIGEAPAQSDVLFASPLDPDRLIRDWLPAIHPKLVIPVHWDDFFRPLSQPIRPISIPFRKIDLEGFRQRIESVFPETKVLVPEIFKDYEWGEIQHECHE